MQIIQWIIGDVSFHQRRTTPYFSKELSALRIGILSSKAWAASNRSMDHDDEMATALRGSRELMKLVGVQCLL